MTNRSISGFPANLLAATFPVAGTSAGMRYRQNLNFAGMFSVENYEGKTVQDKSAYAGRMLGPGVAGRWRSSQRPGLVLSQTL
ncbi:MAG: hypothetical protein WBL63_20250 [Candidatus Acidiferrum sp.]